MYRPGRPGVQGFEAFFAGACGAWAPFEGREIRGLLEWLRGTWRSARPRTRHRLAGQKTEAYLTFPKPFRRMLMWTHRLMIVITYTLTLCNCLGFGQYCKHPLCWTSREIFRDFLEGLSRGPLAQEPLQSSMLWMCSTVASTGRRGMKDNTACFAFCDCISCSSQESPHCLQSSVAK